MVSTDDEFMISADKKITLACKNTALVLDEDGLTVYTPDMVRFLCGDFNLLGPQSYKSQKPVLPPEATYIEQAKS